MPTHLFENSDLTAVTRALIPWTAAVVIPDENQERAYLMRRTTTGHALPEWHGRDLYAQVQVARAARSIYISDALSRLGVATARWVREVIRRASEHRTLREMRA